MNGLTVETLTQIFHFCMLRVEEESLNPSNTEQMMPVIMAACSEANVDERLWYPIGLSFHWINDMGDWVANPHHYTKEAIESYEAQAEYDQTPELPSP